MGGVTLLLLSHSRSNLLPHRCLTFLLKFNHPGTFCTLSLVQPLGWPRGDWAWGYPKKASCHQRKASRRCRCLKAKDQKLPAVWHLCCSGEYYLLSFFKLWECYKVYHRANMEHLFISKSHWLSGQRLFEDHPELQLVRGGAAQAHLNCRKTTSSFCWSK